MRTKRHIKESKHGIRITHPFSRSGILGHYRSQIHYRFSDICLVQTQGNGKIGYFLWH